MKLLELTGVKALKDKDVTQLIHDLSSGDSKFKKAGAGVAAQVFVHEDGTIYKFWVKDSAYEKFVEFIEKNSSNPHLPKLKSKVKELTAFFKKPEHFPDKVKYVKLEKLTPITDDTKFTGARHLIAIDVITSIVNAIELKDDLGTLIAELEEEEGDDLEKPTIAAIAGIFETYQKLLKYPGVSKLNLDTRSANIMKRGNVLVIIDPVALGSEVKFNNLLAKELKGMIAANGTVGGKTPE